MVYNSLYNQYVLFYQITITNYSSLCIMHYIKYMYKIYKYFIISFPKADKIS